MALWGWNYDDPIAHPNRAVGTSNNSISYGLSNIQSKMTSNSTAIITFLIKKVKDKNGNYSTSSFWIRYRVKDKNGVILRIEQKRIEGLQVGDVIRETISLKDVTAGEYMVNFVNDD